MGRFGHGAAYQSRRGLDGLCKIKRSRCSLNHIELVVVHGKHGDGAYHGKVIEPRHLAVRHLQLLAQDEGKGAVLVALRPLGVQVKTHDLRHRHLSNLFFSTRSKR